MDSLYFSIFLTNDKHRYDGLNQCISTIYICIAMIKINGLLWYSLPQLTHHGLPFSVRESLRPWAPSYQRPPQQKKGT